MTINPFAAIFDPDARLQWRRVRYADAERASKALMLLIEANAGTLELRFRRDEAGQKLFIGADSRWFLALTRMETKFDIIVDTHPTPPPHIMKKKVFWRPGSWGDDMRLTKTGLYVATETGPNQIHIKGDELKLPPPTAGLGVHVELPYPVLTPEFAPPEAAWLIGDSPLAAPVGLVGETAAKEFLLSHLVLDTLIHRAAQLPRPTIIIDGDNSLIYRLRQNADFVHLTRSGLVQELSLARAGQMGFNPLDETLPASLGPEDTTANLTLDRWRWWFRGLNVFDTDNIMGEAYARGIRTLPELATFWAAWPQAKVAAHHLQTMVSDDAMRTWLTGDFELREHLLSGGHLLVECAPAEGPRLQALRGLVGLAMETNARLLSVGVRWPNEDDGALRWLSTLCVDRRWDTTVLTRCEAKHIAVLTKKFPAEPLLKEFLPNLPNGIALVNQNDRWWAAAHTGTATLLAEKETPLPAAP